MFRRTLLILILSLLLSSCGGAAPKLETAAPTPDIAETAQPAENTPTPEPTETALPIPSPTQILPTPTETLLPPLDLPGLLPNAPTLLAWDGKPTYLGDSRPGFDFRVMYDPDVWALTEDQFGFPAIGNRNIPYCVISVTSGRGLPPNISVEQDILYADRVTLYVGTAFENGVKKFVTYTGGDGTIITGFMVSFDGQADQCLTDAQMVLTTLRSVPESQATPQP
jgi:hypothetical protein